MLRLSGVLVVVGFVFVSVAFAGAEKSIDGLKDLAGDWRSVGNVSPASIHVNEDGTYQGVAATGAKTTGQITVTGGKASYRSITSEGTVTWSNENGKDVLTFAPSNPRFSPQALERVK